MTATSDESRRVRFAAGEPSCVMLPPRSRTERRETKYRKPDFAMFRKEMQTELISLHANCNPEYAATVCVTGLEKFLDSESKRAKYEATLQVIRDEQSRQKSLGIRDPQAIADLVAIGSCWDRRRAIEVANPKEAKGLIPPSLRKSPVGITNETANATSTLNKASPPGDGKAKKRVHFGDSLQVTFIRGKRRPKEVEKTWYSRKELAAIKWENQNTIKRWRLGSFVDTESDCFRGLERFVPSLQNARRSRRAVIVLVLDEQRRQKENGTVNAKDLRRFSRLYTRSHRRRALEFAALDEAYVSSLGVTSLKKRNQIVAACRKVMGRSRLLRQHSLVL